MVAQLAGDNLLRVVPAFAAELAAGAAGRPRGSRKASAYLDFLGYFMVRLAAGRSGPDCTECAAGTVMSRRWATDRDLQAKDCFSWLNALQASGLITVCCDFIMHVTRIQCLW